MKDKQCIIDDCPCGLGAKWCSTHHCHVDDCPVLQQEKTKQAKWDTREEFKKRFIDGVFGMPKAEDILAFISKVEQDAREDGYEALKEYHRYMLEIFDAKYHSLLDAELNRLLREKSK